MVATDDAGNRNNVIVVEPPFAPVTTKDQLDHGKCQDVVSSQVAEGPINESAGKTPVGHKPVPAAALKRGSQPEELLGVTTDQDIEQRDVKRTSHRAHEDRSEVSDITSINGDLTTGKNLAHLQVNEEDKPSLPTPRLEHAPLFAHERRGPHSESDQPSESQSRQDRSRSPLRRGMSSSLDDPTVEVFPSDRQKILQRIETTKNRFAEDETSVHDSPSSPVFSGQKPADSTPSLGNRSPSLGSVSEEKMTGEGLAKSLNELPQKVRSKLGSSEDAVIVETISVHRPSSLDGADPMTELVLKATTLPAAESGPKFPFAKNDKRESKPATNNDSPSDEGSFQPPTRKEDPMDENGGSPAKNDTHKSKPVVMGSQNDGTSQQSPTRQNRPMTPSSRKSGLEDEHENFLQSFWRVVFVDCLGGLFSSICGTRRRQ